MKLGRPKVSAKVEAAIRDSLAAGTGILKTARTVGVGSGTVQRIKAELAARAKARQGGPSSEQRPWVARQS